MIKYTYEVFEAVSKAATPEEKVKILKDNATDAVKNVVVGIFNPKIEWNLPPTRPPFNASQEYNHPTDFRRQLNELRYFVKGGTGDGMLKMKREARFIALLEGIHPKDAELVLLMVAKKKPKGLTLEIVKEAFPGLIRD